MVGGAIAAALLIGGVVTLLITNNSSSTDVGAAPAKMITELPDQCSLISPATLAEIAPGATCNAPPSAYGKVTSVSPTWTVTSGVKDSTSIKVTLATTADPQKMYAEAKDSVSSFSSAHDIQNSETLAVGDAAEVVGGRSRIIPAASEARAIGYLRSGAVATVTFTSYVDSSTAVAGAKASLSDILLQFQ
ncbi:hypothetical protein GFY24_14235 [Nocardia sp. SYP-A9097]|uniref:hypothetical protein n=1 Tax=Nocardia sp. SYP-A9097 TaxID=2663237 RepID=UPI00129AD484|nr:hypothetical protein [Nocardia sp. SYP-A9097]MRH88588.1 hypothetical protein [Nocardia sp. SYP-A9097]